MKLDIAQKGLKEFLSCIRVLFPSSSSPFWINARDSMLAHSLERSSSVGANGKSKNWSGRSPSTASAEIVIASSVAIVEQFCDPQELITLQSSEGSELCKLYFVQKHQTVVLQHRNTYLSFLARRFVPIYFAEFHSAFHQCLRGFNISQVTQSAARLWKLCCN